MANSQTFKYTLKAVSDISDVLDNVKQLQQAFSKLELPKNIEGQLNKALENVEKNVDKASKAMATGFKTKSNVSAYENATNQIVADWKKISQIINNIDSSKLNFQIDANKAKELGNIIERLRQEIDNINASQLSKIQEIVNKPPSKAGAWKEFLEEFQKGEDGIEGAQKALNRLQQQLDKAKAAGKVGTGISQEWDNYAKGVEVYKTALQNLKGEVGEAAEKQKELNTAEKEQVDLQNQANQQGQTYYKQLTQDVKQATDQTEKLVKSEQQVNAETQRFGSELDQFKSRIQYFFGLNNAVRLFQRSVRSAFNTIKDLDKVMTETAVVTKFDVGDMWAQLPEYTQRANELGVSIHDAYEAATLYYQQGLDTNEVMAVSNETLKMARIAGLDAADATDRMTNALRGFNMTITETNAQNINDVYSNLAAKTASNVDEISTAMTKVASLAHNANMSFENTAAFLSQIIETTRESAETAGTALKTVIARFSEVKSLYSEGELLGDFEGEEIDVNKVSKALRTAGINLNEYLTGAKGLDDIFMELSEKWDGLDQVQQRYIATMAAGSRQQSRFIALMQDNARMTELVKEANNATGASQEQFEKTLDSMETKLNQLKNAWDTYLMGLSNNQVIKAVIDSLTFLIDKLNKLLELIDKADITGTGLLKSFASLGAVFGGLKIGDSIFKRMFANAGKIFRQEGTKAGQAMLAGIREGAQKGGGLKDLFKVTKLDTSIMDSYNKSLQQTALAAKNVEKAQINLAVAQEKENQATMAGWMATERQEEAYFETMAAQQGLATANTELAAAKEAEAIASAEVVGVNKLEMTDKEKAILLSLAAKDATLKEALAEGELTAAEARELIARNMGNKGILAQIVYTKASTIATKAETGSIWNKVAAWIADKIAAENAFVAEMMALGVIGLIIAAVVGLIALIVLLVKTIKDSTPEAKLKALEEATEEASDAADKAAEAYDNLNDSIEKLKDGYARIEELTRGTKEWKEAVQEVNSEVIGLADTYSEFSSLIKSEGGVLKIDFDSATAQNILDEYARREVEASNALLKTQINKARQSQQVLYNNFLNNESIYLKTNYGDATFSQLTDTFKLLASGEISNTEQLVSYMRENDMFIYPRSDNDNPDEVYEKVRNLAISIEQVNDQIDAYTKAIGANVIQMSKIGPEMTSFATNYLTKERISTFTTRAELNLDFSRENKKRLQLEYAQDKGYNTYESYVAENGALNDEILKAYIIQKRASESAVESLENFAKSLEKASDDIKSIYGKAEGGALTQENIGKLSGKAYTELAEMTVESIQEDEDLKERIKKAYSELYGIDADEIKEDSDEFKLFAQDFSEAILFASRSFVNATKLIDDEGIKKLLGTGAFAELDADQTKKFTNNLADIYATSGKEVATSFMKNVDSVMRGLSTEQRNKFMDYLGSLDWTNIKDIKSLGQDLRDIGIPINEASDAFQDMIGIMLELADASQQINVENIKKAIEALQPLRAKFAKGEATRTWTKDEFEAMKPYLDSGILAQFSIDDDGNYVYLGNSMEDLKNAIEDATAVLKADEKTNLENQIKARDILGGEVSYREYKNGVGSINTISLTDENIGNLSADAKKQIIGQYLKQLKDSYTDEELEGLGLGINKDTTIESILKSGQLNEFFNRFVTLATDSGLESLLEQLTKDQAVWDYTGSDLNEILADVGTNDAAFKALQLRALNAGMGTDIFSQFNESNAQGFTNAIAAYQEAGTLGLDITKLEEYINELMKLRNLSVDVATQVALANTKLNTGLGEIIDSYKDWTELIDKNGQINANASEDVEIFNKLKKSVNEMLNTTEDLSDEFWKSKENIKLIKEAAEGSVEAVAKLQKIAFKDLLDNLELHVDEEHAEQDILNIIDDLNDIINDTKLPELEAGVELNREQYGEFIDDLYNLMVAANMTEDEINDALGRIGYEVKITYKKAPLPKVNKRELGNDTFGLLYDVNYEPIEIPEIHFVSTGSGGGGVSTPNINKGKSNKSSSTSGKTPSSSKPSYWKNPYDELFNLQEKINEALRQREALERKYQKMLKLESTTMADIRKGYFDQINMMRQQIQLQQQLAAGRMRQIQNLGNQYYTDSEGRRRTFASLGVTRYASYNAETGTITIDWQGLEAIANDPNRTAEGEAAEAYINMLQDLVDSYEDVRDAIWEIEDAIEDLTNEAINSYISFEDRVMEAVVAQYEKEIDTLEKMNDAISDATNKMLDAIQEEINAQRQARSNAKTEQDIAEKEARLAYLRRDTSGANDLQIMQLEKELEDARQNYEDTLIDQALEQMRKDADLAAEQRAQQIEVMRAQLEIAKENGSLWNEVYDLINSATGEDGTLDFNSRLIQLLQESEAFAAMSAFASDEWMKKLAEEFRAALGGLAAGGADYSGQHEGEGGGTGGSDAGSGGAGGEGSGGTTEAPEGWPAGWPLPSETTGVIKKGSKGIPVKSIQRALNELGITDSNGNLLTVDGDFGNKTEQAVKKFQTQEGITPDGKVGNDTRRKFALHHYKSGGLVDFTGPAWLDGSKSSPEMVLSAKDTENFIKLRDMLARISNGITTPGAPSNTYVDINVNAEIDSDYSVDRLVERLKEDLFHDGTYRNVNSISRIR